MNVKTILLGTALLMLLGSNLMNSSEPLPPLDEEKIQVHWMKEGDVAPFDGLLMNDYTYHRIRLKLIEEGM